MRGIVFLAVVLQAGCSLFKGASEVHDDLALSDFGSCVRALPAPGAAKKYVVAPCAGRSPSRLVGQSRDDMTAAFGAASSCEPRPGRVFSGDFPECATAPVLAYSFYREAPPVARISYRPRLGSVSGVAMADHSEDVDSRSSPKKGGPELVISFDENGKVAEAHWRQASGD